MKRISKSPITDHNKYKQTDQLYDPLREALRKSSVSKLSEKPGSHNTEIKGSLVSKQLHEFSPEEAQYLKKQILIPVNRRLRPTGEHSEIQGKRFHAINYLQKYGTPLTQEQFKAIYKGEAVDEEIYRISEGSSSKDSQGRLTPDPILIKQYSQKTGGDKNEKYVPEPSFENGSKTKFQKGISINKQPPQTKIQPLNRQSSESYYFETYGADQQAPQVRYTPNGLNKAKVSGIRNTLVQSRTSQQNINKLNSLENLHSSQKFQKKSSGSDKLNKVDSQKQQSIDFNQIVGISSDNQKQNEGQYRFKSGTYASQGLSAGSGAVEGISSLKKNKSPYKYNVFSALDEGVNSKCTSFGKNQIVAREINNKKWS